MIEQYWWHRWLGKATSSQSIEIEEPRDNGCGNDGKFIESGNTAGADYRADITYQGISIKNCPIEIKWVPTAGKFTLKENDLKAYVREGAGILFIYNDVKCGTDLRKPKDHDLDNHIKLIESKISQIKWAFMWPSSVEDFYDCSRENNLFRPINYMGGKSAVVLSQVDFDKWFTQEDWE
jgi:hypothetical protein